MKKILFLCILILSIAEWSHSQQQTTIRKSEIIENINGKDFYLHFVKQGETLFEIAKAYGTKVDDLFKSNPESRAGIKPGQILKIPVVTQKIPVSSTPETNQEYFLHIVKSKETLYGIAKKYGVEIEDIKKLNPGIGEQLQEGYTLKIPVVKDETSADQEWTGTTVTHTVSQGETLYGIARQYEVTIGEIKNANPGMPDVIKIGDVINIPNQMVQEAEKPEPSKDKFIKHQIKPNESIYIIAKNYAISVDSIKYYNTGLTGDFMQGQVIRIPVTHPSVNYILHTSDRKEKLESIATMYEVDYYDLLLMNPGIHRKVDKEQQIRIPIEISYKEEEEKVNEIDVLQDKKTPCKNIAANMERTYNIALMLPLYLEEIDSLQLREKIDGSDLARMSSFRFINFYEGFLMAVDSMADAGMKMNLFIYDVDNSIDKINKVLHASELSSMDLIIGPLFSDAFDKMATFAKMYEIHIINPLSVREEVISGNPFVIKIKPANHSQIDNLVSYIEQNFENYNVVIARRNQYKFQAEVSYIRNYLNSRRKTNLFISNTRISDVMKSKNNMDQLFTENMLFDLEALKDKLDDSTLIVNTVKELLYVGDSTAGLGMNLSRLRPNVVIVFSEDKVFAQEILSQLNKILSDHEIILFGLPEWTKFTDLETSHLLNLNLHCFSSSIVDYESRRIKEWIMAYRGLYKTEPTPANYAFDGFDIGWYFLNALYLFGSNFTQCTDDFDIQLIQTKYKFEQISANGYQNIYWDLGKYKNYKFVKVPK